MGEPRSHIASSTPTSISIRGLDLVSDVLGRVDLGAMAFLEVTGRLPQPSEAVVFNAIVVSLVEHGLTPSVLAARLTNFGEPNALQAAIAAGLLGLGSVFVGSAEGAARLLQETPTDISAAAIVERYRLSRTPIPGLGHPIHRDGDPRTARLYEIAEANGLRGAHVQRLDEIHEEAERQLGKKLPVNATGAVGALATELGLPWQACRGLGAIARSIGLVGHILEEIKEPIAPHLWHVAEGWEARV